MKLVSSSFRINTAPAQKASAGAARLNMGSSPDREAVQVIGATPHRLEMCALLGKLKLLAVNRPPKVTPDRRPILTPLASGIGRVLGLASSAVGQKSRERARFQLAL